MWQFSWTATTKAAAVAQIAAEPNVPQPTRNNLTAAVNALAPTAGQVITVESSGDFDPATGGGYANLRAVARMQFT